MSPLVTVAICTWNRAPLLREVLENLAAATRRVSSDWELVVVNNNCTDETDSVLSLFAGKLPLRPVFEPQPGLSNARNAAIKAARGGYIAWTDDDVIVSPTWLSAYIDAIAKRPSASIFGGPIRPRFDGNPPAWLVRAMPHVATAFAIRDLGTESFLLAPDPARMPFGANYVIRADQQARFPYDPRLGRRPGAPLIGGEEIAVMLSILKGGGEGWWIPEAGLEHRVPVERQNVGYLRRYFEGQAMGHGVGQASGAPRLFGRPRWLLRQAIETELEYFAKRVLMDPEEWAPALVRASTARGLLKARA